MVWKRMPDAMTITEISDKKPSSLESAAFKSVQLSVVVMTHNEAANIRRCLESVKPVADEVLVVDSFSKDDTVAIATSMGARVVQHAFEGFISQRAFCVHQARYDHVLALDADESLSEDLQNSILKIKTNWQYDCYFLPRRNNIGGKWIRFGGWSPSGIVRLFDRRKAICSGSEPHDRIQPLRQATTNRLEAYLLHWSNEDISSLLTSINRHSAAAAQTYFEKGRKPSWIRLLFKPGIKFFTFYLLRLGILDGFYGYVLAKSAAQYIFLKEAKLMELYRRKREKR